MREVPPGTSDFEAREREFLKRALTDPSWLFREMDLHLDRVAFLPVKPEVYNHSAFLDHRLEGVSGQPVVTRLETLIAAATRAGPAATNWVFHPGHVGSTLLSRLLGELDEVLPLREPPPLRTLSALWREQGDPLAQLDREGFERLEHAVWVLLGRTFRETQQSLVKATSDCCNLLGRALAAHPESRVIWIDVDLETFLAGMLRNQPRRQETRAFAQSRLMDLHFLLDDRTVRLFELDIPRLTAVSWLANQGHRIRAQQGAAAGRILTLHFHDLLETPAAVLPGVLDHLGLPSDEFTLSRVLASPWRRTYAKQRDSAFSTGQRFEQLTKSRHENAADIEAGLAFAEQLCREHAILEPLRSRLGRPA